MHSAKYSSVRQSCMMLRCYDYDDDTTCVGAHHNRPECIVRPPCSRCHRTHTHTFTQTHTRVWIIILQYIYYRIFMVSYFWSNGQREKVEREPWTRCTSCALWYTLRSNKYGYVYRIIFRGEQKAATTSPPLYWKLF